MEANNASRSTTLYFSNMIDALHFLQTAFDVSITIVLRCQECPYKIKVVSQVLVRNLSNIFWQKSYIIIYLYVVNSGQRIFFVFAHFEQNFEIY